MQYWTHLRPKQWSRCWPNKDTLPCVTVTLILLSIIVTKRHTHSSLNPITTPACHSFSGSFSICECSSMGKCRDWLHNVKLGCKVCKLNQFVSTWFTGTTCTWFKLYIKRCGINFQLYSDFKVQHWFNLCINSTPCVSTQPVSIPCINSASKSIQGAASIWPVIESSTN